MQGVGCALGAGVGGGEGRRGGWGGGCKKRRPPLKCEWQSCSLVIMRENILKVQTAGDTDSHCGDIKHQTVAKGDSSANTQVGVRALIMCKKPPSGVSACICRGVILRWFYQ